MCEQHDLLVLSKFKNLILWDLLAGNKQSEMAAAIGISDTVFCELMNLKRSPVTKTGQYTTSAKRIAAHFGLSADLVFPLSLYQLGLPSVVERTYDSVKLLPLLAARNEMSALPSPDQNVFSNELKNALGKACGALTRQEKRILRLRFGLDGNGAHTLEKIAASMGYSGQNVSRIQNKTLRKLRQLLPPELSLSV